MAAPSRNERDAYDGLSQVAHAIRRSTALHVAMSILPPEATVSQLLRQADELAAWIRGSAGAHEDDAEPGAEPLGKPWPPVD